MSAGAAPAGSVLRPRPAFLLLGLLSGLSLAALDQTIMASAMPVIVGSLGDLSWVAWAATGYLTASTVATPIVGRGSDVFGARRLFHLALIVFVAGGVGVALSQSVAQLVVFRAVQGVGSGAIVALVQVILGDLISARERTRYFGLITALYVVASAAGPAIGGLFVDHLSWRWLVLVDVPFVLVSLLVTRRTVPVRTRPRPGGLDVRGAVLIAGALTALMLVVARSGGPLTPSWPRLAAIASCVVLVALFAVHVRRAPFPILPPSIFRNAACRSSILASFCIGVVLFSSIFFLPVFCQVIWGASTAVSGLVLVPLMCGMVVTTTLVGRRIAHSGHYRRYPIAGSCAAAVAVALLGTAGPDSLAVVVGATALLGLGLGATTQVLIVAAQNAAQDGDVGVVTSTVTLFRLLGGALGSALVGVVIQRRLSDASEALRGAAQPIRLGGLTPHEIRALPPQSRDVVVDAFAGGMHAAFLWLLPAALAAAVLCALARELPLRTVARAAATPDAGA